jgi:hypothetical protein
MIHTCKQYKDILEACNAYRIALEKVIAYCAENNIDLEY